MDCKDAKEDCTPGRRVLLVALAIFFVTLVVYSRAVTCDFVNYDDDKFVYNNPIVQQGLTAEGVAWAVKSRYPMMWQPLTWISRMADVSLFGLDPRGHHLVNVLLHAANAALLFLILRAMTGALWRSAFVAALFALHPLHVESVAWVTERKDVLSSFFWLLTMAAYLLYTRRGTARHYLLVLLALVCGLASKPMLVTLPFVLLLLDFWPLGRMSLGGERKETAVPLGPLLLEKVPLLLLAVGSVIITLPAQAAGYMTKVELNLADRLANAAVSYATYVVKTVWPSGLAFLYPHPLGGLPPWKVLASVVLLLLLTSLVLWQIRKRPALFVGWFWFVGTLVPVIGVLQVGVQSMADRFTYIPLVGLFIMFAWAAAEIPAGPYRRALPAAAGALLAAFAAVTVVQIGYWQNSLTLMSRAVAVTEGNYVAHTNLGTSHSAEGRFEEAKAHYKEAIRIHPEHATALYNLGRAYYRDGRYDDALGLLQRAVKRTPRDVDTHVMLGSTFLQLKRYEEAVRSLRRALQLDPENTGARNSLGIALTRLGRNEEGGKHIAQTMRRDPRTRAIVFYRTGNSFLAKGDTARAVENYRKALQIAPDLIEAREALRRAQGNPEGRSLSP